MEQMKALFMSHGDGRSSVRTDRCTSGRFSFYSLEKRPGMSVWLTTLQISVSTGQQDKQGSVISAFNELQCLSLPCLPG
ncbi:unnamed protein product [Arctogadus glacialis]